MSSFGRLEVSVTFCDCSQSLKLQFAISEFPLTNPPNFCTIDPTMPTSKSLVPVERIEKSILLIRGHKVMLDGDLAELYGVTTAALNQAVKRNIGRFPEDFAFQLTEDEFASLISQIVTSKTGRGGRRKLPWAFTEHGILMLSSVLRSERAVQANIQIMRAFIRMRQLLASNKGLMQKILSMEKKYDEQFKKVFQAIYQLMIEEEKPKRQIGFKTKDDK